MNAVKPILRWPGGKTRMLKKLLPMIPRHSCYGEVFAGGLALLLAKEPSKVEVVNDINRDLVGLYRNVQYHLPELLRELEFIQNGRTELFDFIAQPGITEIQRAARWFVRNRISFGGGMQSFAVGKTHHINSKERNREMIEALNQRLSNVAVENLPYERLMKNYDSAESFFFLDPPYLKSDCSAYDGFSPEQMEDLEKHLRKVKGNWILTVDDNAFNRALFKGRKMEEVTTVNRRVNVRTAKNATFGELIITK